MSILTLSERVQDIWGLFWKMIGVSARAQMQYRASFLMMTLGQLLTTSTEFLAIWALFQRFGSLRGWGLAEVALFYGMTNIAFALAEGIGRGFDLFPNLVKSGDFDRLLLRPRSLAFQVAAREVSLRTGRLLQGFVVLFWSMRHLHVEWTPARLLLVILIVAGGMCLFYGLFVLQATLSFWTIESLEIMNTITYGGTETAQDPMTIYRPWFRRFFTFVIPLACINYLPAGLLLTRPHPLLSQASWLYMAPLVGVLFLVVSLQAWKVGVRHYCSTGS